MVDYEKVPLDEKNRESNGGAPPVYVRDLEDCITDEEPKHTFRDMRIDDSQTDVGDHFCTSLFGTICCCWPFGALALYYNHLSQKAQVKGEYLVAHSNSRRARLCALSSILLGSIFIVLYTYFVYHSLKQMQHPNQPLDDPSANP
eukprot:Clim_evm42s242 gene=Clim_evmTU42s242